MTEPKIRAHFFEGFEPFIAQRGIDFDDLIKSHGVNRDDLSDSDNEISLNAAASILNDAALRCDDPCLGIHWAEAMKSGTSGVLGYLMLNARTVRAALEAISRYAALHVDPVDVSFSESEGIGSLSWKFPPSFTASRTQYTSFAMAIAIIRLRRIAGPEWSPIGVEFEHRAPGDRSEIRRILGPNVTFDRPQNVLRIRESVLNRTSDKADERLFKLIRDLGDRLLNERKTAKDIVYQTRYAIVRSCESGTLALEDVAGEMNVTPRTLQSQLAAAGTNFETLVQETREGLADIYLRDTDLPLTEIAFLLGFSELSAFTRAARGWFGVPPSVRRSDLRTTAPNPQ